MSNPWDDAICFDRPETLCATGRNMAATNNYKWPDFSWLRVHPNWNARRIIEWSYLVAVFEKNADADCLLSSHMGLQRAIARFKGTAIAV